MSYYAVAKGRKIGIYTNWEDCRAQIDGFSGAVFKKFNTEKEASKYITSNKFLSGSTRLCILCSKPMATKGKLCKSCKYKSRKLGDSLGLKFKISQTNLVFVKSTYKCNDVFKFIESHPEKLLDAITYKSYEEKRTIKHNYIQSIDTTAKYHKGDPIPQFVKDIFGRNKTVVSVTGDKNNPNIIYICRKCGETLYTRYSDYKMSHGHNCEGIKSSGEVFVEHFLKQNKIKYTTQYGTLTCINPDTGYVLPYDFELTDRKILIEVQGEQHRKFIPKFHVTEKGFEYQVKKDKYKRAFAESKGYKLIEVWYEDLDEERLKRLICYNKI